MFKKILSNRKQIKSSGIDTETKDLLKALNLLYLRIFSVSFVVDVLIALILFFLVKSVPLLIMLISIIVALNAFCTKDVAKSTEKICEICNKKKYN